jgi:hypothetical protein
VRTLTECILNAGLSERVFDEVQLAHLVGGDKSRRYGLVSSACRAGELHRLRRGLYVLDERFREQAAHPFVLAQALDPGSYVSLETALAHHGWIRKAVTETTSITPGRKSKHYSHKVFGRFDFYPLALTKDCLLELIMHKQINEQTMLIARPCRALMDLVYLRKAEWQGLDWLVEDLCVDIGKLLSISSEDLKILKFVYKQRRIKTFIDRLVRELFDD